jgi:DNA topoisomerase-1
VLRSDVGHPTSSEVRPWDGSISSRPLKFDGTPRTADQPPALFNEGSLIRFLETHGVGRPSTYASIIDKLGERGYIERGKNPYTRTQNTNAYIASTDDRVITKQSTTLTIGNSTSSDLFVPTKIGHSVTEFLAEHFTNLLNISFTATMETLLDKISENAVTKEHVLNDFYGAFSKLLHQATRTQKQSVSTILYDDGQFQIKHTKYGPALYDVRHKKYTSLSGFMQWKKIRSDAIRPEDFAFLKRLPITLSGTNFAVHLGRYGLYIKDGSKNIPLQKSLWKKAYDGTLTSSDISAHHRV